MKLTGLAAAVLAVGAPTLASHTLRFSPAEGAELTRVITWTLASKTDEVATTLDGEPTGEVPTLSYTSERKVSLGATDRLEAVADGRPAKLVREYTDLLVEYEAELTLDVMGQSAELPVSGDGTSALEGCAVRFSWSEDEGGWVATWADDTKRGPDALLGTVRADLDVLGLLPSGAVDIGDTWAVDLGALVDVLFPGGDVGLALETDLGQLEGALDPAALPTVVDVLRDGEREGEATCKLVAVEGEVAQVALTLNVRASGDFASDVEDIVDAAAPEGVTADVTRADFQLTLTGEGTLAFGLTTGHVATFTFDGESREESLIAATVDADGQSMEFEQSHTRSGTVTVRTTIE